MTNKQNWRQISEHITQATHQSFIMTDAHSVSGGCVNSAYIIQSENKSYFVKLNQRTLLAMFKAEFLGLKEIAQSNTVKVPQPIICGVTDRYAFIVLENLTLSTKPSRQSQQDMGHQLAQLHKIQQKYFGWHRNNTIGTTEQINKPANDWMRFWADNRLGFQLSLADSNGYRGKLIQSGTKLIETLACFFSHDARPSLLHGDLWSGNAAVTDKGEAVVYDPACYYGDRETDIAMTELFGGFSADFYAAYNETYPLHSDYSIRKTLYNLYHILNHLNLFGEGYLHQAQNAINFLLAEIS